MNADMADSSNLVKQLIIKAEDARLLGDMKAMRRYYRMLADMNRCGPERAGWLARRHCPRCGGRLCGLPARQLLALGPSTYTGWLTAPIRSRCTPVPLPALPAAT